MRDTAYLALKARENMLKTSVEEPSMMEIAEEIGVPYRSVACALDAVSEPLSLHDSVFSSGDDAVEIMDSLADEKENADNWSEKISLYEALKNIPERELLVVKLRYFDGKTQVEISDLIGISQAQVSRLEKSAISKLQAALLCD